LADKARVERRITLGLAIFLLVIALPLMGLSAVIAADAFARLPETREGFLVLSFPLTFALFFSVMAWRGFASANHVGPVLTVRGWRILAGALLAVGGVGALGHWAGLVLPLVAAFLCLCNDPVVRRFLTSIGFVP
jgi:hypothetical protein